MPSINQGSVVSGIVVDLDPTENNTYASDWNYIRNRLNEYKNCIRVRIPVVHGLKNKTGLPSDTQKIDGETVNYNTKFGYVEDKGLPWVPVCYPISSSGPIHDPQDPLNDEKMSQKYYLSKNEIVYLIFSGSKSSGPIVIGTSGVFYQPEELAESPSRVDVSVKIYDNLVKPTVGPINPIIYKNATLYYSEIDKGLDEAISSGLDPKFKTTFHQAVLAMSRTEGGQGKSGIYTKTNNCFGIVTISGWSGGKVYVKNTGKYYNSFAEIPESNPGLVFRVYDTIQDSVIDYCTLISSPHYNTALTKSSSIEYLQEILSKGYGEPGMINLWSKLINNPNEDINRYLANSQ